MPLEVDAIFERYALAELQSYRGNLEGAMEAAREGWLPAPDDPDMAEHFAKLEAHLAAGGTPESDRFLLGVGLTAPGRFRAIHPPLMVLDANRGGLSASRLRDASGQVTRLREALELARTVLPGMPADTQLAVAECLRRCPAGRRPAPAPDALRELEALSEAQVAALADRALALLRPTLPGQVGEVGLAILVDLSTRRNAPLPAAVHLALLERDIVYPPSMFRDACEQVATILVAQLDAARATTDTLRLDHRLRALAFSRAPAVEEAFRRWQETPPKWVCRLHVPPAHYLHEAGSCLTPDGACRELYASACYLLAPMPDDPAAGPTPEGGIVVPNRQPSGQQCPTCSDQLYWLFDFTALAATIPEALPPGAPRRVLACLSCSCWSEPWFATYTADGDMTPLYTEPGEPRESEPEPPVLCVLDPRPLSPYTAAKSFGLNDLSTIGGLPMWVQDTAYPDCPACAQAMTFLAQFDKSALQYEEGLFYTFFCSPCRTVAINYQQT